MTDPESSVALALDATELAAPDRGRVVPLLLLAEPSASALEWSFSNLSDTVYRFDLAGTLVGAATMRWRDDPSELVELAVDEAHQGHGIGRRIVDWLVAEGRRRGRRAIEVGTSSTSLGNIAFYQKCGFRPSAVRTSGAGAEHAASATKPADASERRRSMSGEVVDARAQRQPT